MADERPRSGEPGSDRTDQPADTADADGAAGTTDGDASEASNDRRTDRRAGRRLRSRRGGRRRSGLIDEEFAEPGAAAAAAGRRVRRRAWLRIGAASLVAIVLIGAAVAVTLWPNDDENPDPPDVEPTTDAGASLLVVVEDDSRRIASLALISTQSGGSSRVMLFPPALVTVIPGFGERPISDAMALGGLELAELTISNLLGVRIDGRVGFDEQSLADALGSDIDVDLLEPFVVSEGTTERVLVAEGQQAIDPATTAQMLADQGRDDQLDWLIRQGAVWEGIVELVGIDASALSRILEGTEGDPLRAEQALGNAASAEEFLVTAIPVNRVSVGDGEAYAFDGPSPEGVVSGAFPYLALAEEPRIRVEVLSGTDVIGSTRPVVARLIREGYRVLLTDNAAGDRFETSEIVAQSRAVQDAAVAVQRLLGTGEVFLNVDQPSGVVDLTIIVGADLAGG